MGKNRVVITGMGIVAPNACSLEDYEVALKRGKSGISYHKVLKEMGFRCQVGGIPNAEEIESKLSTYFSRDLQTTSNEAIKYAGIAAFDAWRDAGLEVVPHQEERVFWDTGCIIGCGTAGVDTIVQKVIPKVAAKKIRSLGASVVEQSMPSAPSVKVAGLLGLGGQVSANSSACATGTEAVIEGFYKIRHNLARRMLTGSVEGSEPHIWAAFDAMRILNPNWNESPTQASRPLSQSAKGFIPGAGSGVLILEELDMALKRNAKIYAEILGVAVNCGGQRQGGSITAPNPNGVQRCIRTAVKEANIHGSEINAINGHLTASFADPMEIENWKKALELKPEEMPYINATKSLIGHGLSAAGSMELVACVLQLNKNFLHPSLNCEDLHTAILPYEKSIVRATKKCELHIIAKSSFGFGDVNSCIILKKWEKHTGTIEQRL